MSYTITWLVLKISIFCENDDNHEDEDDQEDDHDNKHDVNQDDDKTESHLDWKIEI